MSTGVAGCHKHKNTAALFFASRRPPPRDSASPYVYRSPPPFKCYTFNQTQSKPHSHSKGIMKHTYTWISSSCPLHWWLGHLRLCADTHSHIHTRRSYSCQMHTAISNTHHTHIQHDTHTHTLSLPLTHTHTHSLSLSSVRTHTHTHTYFSQSTWVLLPHRQTLRCHRCHHSRCFPQASSSSCWTSCCKTHPLLCTETVLGGNLSEHIPNTLLTAKHTQWHTSLYTKVLRMKSEWTHTSHCKMNSSNGSSCSHCIQTSQRGPTLAANPCCAS